jgi:hypothetical protein
LARADLHKATAIDAGSDVVDVSRRAARACVLAWRSALIVHGASLRVAIVRCFGERDTIERGTIERDPIERDPIGRGPIGHRTVRLHLEFLEFGAEERFARERKHAA